MKATMENLIGKMFTMSKLFIAVAVLAAIWGVPSESHALPGTLSGCVTTTEVRTNPSTADTGRLWTSRPGNVRQVRRVLIHLHLNTVIGLNYYTVTNDSGCYRIAWDDLSALWYPVSAQVKVIWASPDMALGTQRITPPARLFTIDNGPISSDITTTRNVYLNATTTLNVAVNGAEAGEHTAAYLTTQEFYQRVVRQSTAFLDMMKRVHVHINSTPVAEELQGGIAPTANDVYLSGGTATASAFTVAHELGHIVAWRNLGLLVAPFRADFSDYACYGDTDRTHDWNTSECEKAAWNEGFAHFVAAAWMWARTAPRPVIPVVDRGFNLESGTCTNPGAGNECSQAKALWDIYDSPWTGDDDGITNRNMASITAVLRGYPDNCPYPLVSDNHCSNEGDPLGLNSWDLNALNHRDFRANWIRVLGTSQINQIDAIYLQNFIFGGDPN